MVEWQVSALWVCRIFCNRHHCTGRRRLCWCCIVCLQQFLKCAMLSMEGDRCSACVAPPTTTSYVLSLRWPRECHLMNWNVTATVWHSGSLHMHLDVAVCALIVSMAHILWHIWHRNDASSTLIAIFRLSVQVSIGLLWSLGAVIRTRVVTFTEK